MGLQTDDTTLCYHGALSRRADCDPPARPDIAHMFRTMILAFALACLAAADTICDLTTVNGNDYSGLCDGTFDGKSVCAFRIPSPGRRVHTGIGARRVGVVRGHREGSGAGGNG